MHSFTVETKILRKVAQTNPHTIWPAYLPCVRKKPNIVVVVYYSSKNIIEYDHLTESVKVINELPFDSEDSDVDY